MPSEKEIRMDKKAVLYDYLKVRKAIQEGKGLEAIESVIERTVAFMDDDDVASVEKKMRDK